MKNDFRDPTSIPSNLDDLKAYYEKEIASRDASITDLQHELLQKTKMCDDLLETIARLRAEKNGEGVKVGAMPKQERIVQETRKAEIKIGREPPVSVNTTDKRSSFKRAPQSESCIMTKKDQQKSHSGVDNKHVESVKGTHASSLPSSPTQAKKKFTVRVDKCEICTKSVYPMEKLVADGIVFHKVCLRCAECSKVLNLGNYAALEGKFYCKPHFKQLFMKKGNYDEGFGREQHKKKWEAKS